MTEMWRENFEVGDQVVYLGTTDAQVNWGANTDPRGILNEGNTYIIEDIRVHSQHTKLTLSGIAGRFNSVSFEKL
jgi:hypothetical protein